MNHKRVERLWRKEGLRVPRKQPKRGRLWLAEGAIVRRRAERPNDVCSYDFVFERTADGRALKLLVVVDEYTRECLAIVVARRLTSIEERACLAERFVRRAVPAHIRSDNGPEFAAKAVPHWLERVAVQTLFIEPGSAWENGYVESLNGKLRDECLKRERFDTLLEAQILIEQWRFEYNHLRLHRRLDQLFASPSCRWRYQSYPKKCYNAWGHATSSPAGTALAAKGLWAKSAPRRRGVAPSPTRTASESSSACAHPSRSSATLRSWRSRGMSVRRPGPLLSVRWAGV